MLLMRRNLRPCLDLVKPNTRRTVENQQANQSSGHSLTRQFMVGQPVAVREYRKYQKWVPGVISSRNGPLSYQVEVSGNATWKRHVDQMRDSRISPAMEAIPDSFTIPISTPPADDEMKTKASDPANRLESRTSTTLDRNQKRTPEPTVRRSQLIRRTPQRLDL